MWKSSDKIEAVFLRTYKELCFVAYNYLGNTKDAEDIVQDTFIVLMDGKHLEIKNIKSYLKTTVRNACLKRLKENNKFVFNEALAADIECADSIETDLMYLEKQHYLFSKLENLPNKCREVLLLNVVEGKKYKEVAEILGVSINTVKSQRKKALKILRSSLQDVYLFFFVFKNNLDFFKNN